MSVAPKISLSEEERTTLSVWLRLPTPDRLALRARIILLAADGRTNQEIVSELRTAPKTVSLWRRRFLEGRLPGIIKETRRKRGSKVDEATVRLILWKIGERRGGATGVTIRSLAKELGIPPTTLYDIWKNHLPNSCQE